MDAAPLSGSLPAWQVLLEGPQDSRWHTGERLSARPWHKAGAQRAVSPRGRCFLPVCALSPAGTRAGRYQPQRAPGGASQPRGATRLTSVSSGLLLPTRWEVFLSLPPILQTRKPRLHEEQRSLNLPVLWPPAYNGIRQAREQQGQPGAGCSCSRAVRAGSGNVQQGLSPGSRREPWTAAREAGAADPNLG